MFLPASAQAPILEVPICTHSPLPVDPHGLPDCTFPQLVRFACATLYFWALRTIGSFLRVLDIAGLTGSYLLTA
jgi:hypothetical protein